MGVEPDLTVFGKVIAGGYPPGAGGVGGKEEFRKYLAAGIQTGDKVKKALVGGTMAATPLSALAGYYTLKRIHETNACEKANAMGDRLTAGLKALIKSTICPSLPSTKALYVTWKRSVPCILASTGQNPGPFPRSCMKPRNAKPRWNIWARRIWRKAW